MKIKIELPDVEYLKEILHYDYEEGKLYWKRGNNRNIIAGELAGSLSDNAYRTICIDGRKGYLAHRIVWKMHYGEEPTFYIDHINGNKDDNRICNLRKASKAENCRNVLKRPNNRSGYKNIFHTSKITSAGNLINGWRVKIVTNSKRYTKRFPYNNKIVRDKERVLLVALAHRDDKLKELHGEFANYD